MQVLIGTPLEYRGNSQGAIPHGMRNVASFSFVAVEFPHQQRAGVHTWDSNVFKCQNRPEGKCNSKGSWTLVKYFTNSQFTDSWTINVWEIRCELEKSLLREFKEKAELPKFIAVCPSLASCTIYWEFLGYFHSSLLYGMTQIRDILKNSHPLFKDIEIKNKIQEYNKHGVVPAAIFMGGSNFLIEMAIGGCISSVECCMADVRPRVWFPALKRKKKGDKESFKWPHKAM